MASSRPRRPPFFWIVLGLGIGLALLFAAAFVLVVRHGGREGRLGWQPAPATDGGVLVASVDPSGPATGSLAPGDRVVAVDGDHRVSWASFSWLIEPLPIGSDYTLRVFREGRELERRLRVTARTRPGWEWTALVRAFVALVLCATGLTVGLLRPEQRVARLYSLAVLLSAPIFFANPLLLDMLRSAVLTRGEALVVWLCRIHSPFHGAVGFHFALEFPHGGQRGRGWRRARALFYLWAGIVCAFYHLEYYFTVLRPDQAVALTWDHPQLWRALFTLDSLFGPVIFAAVPIAIVRNAREQTSPGERRRMRWALFGAIVGFLPATAALSLHYRGPLARGIDRRFFREAYDQEQVLLSLADDIRARDSLTDLSRLVSDRLGATIHPERLYLVYRSLEGRDFALEYSSGGGSSGLRIPQDAAIVGLMEARAAALEPESEEGGLPADEQEWLSRLGVRLVVPMLTAEGRLVGMILLGEKKSEVPYGRDDRRLLQAVATQIAIVYENTALKQRVAREERARREVLSRLAGEEVHLVGTEGAYLVMELLMGASLRTEIDHRGTLPPALAADWFDQVAEGVEAAHGAGVVHRDLKPENVLVTRDPHGREVVKILDFGLAKLSFGDPPDPQSLTVPGTILGTLRYMSPEQLSGEHTDERSDIFSIGVLVVEALTGRHPFLAPTTASMVTGILQEPFHLEGDAPEVKELDLVLQRCLAKNRAGRFSSAAEMRRELIPAIRGCPPFPGTPRRAWDHETIADDASRRTEGR